MDKDTLRLIHGEWPAAGAELEDNSIDTIITDPSYGLSKEPDAEAMLRAWLEGMAYEHNASGGFMGKEWDKFVPGPLHWKEAYRVLKPGGLMLVFGAPRTHDLVTLAIRLAKFEIRDCMMWLYGSGMPKGGNVSKLIDKAAGAERPVIGERKLWGNAAVSCKDKGGTYGVNVGVAPEMWVPITGPSTDLAIRFDGYHTGLAPGWEPIIVAMKPREGTFAQNAERWGVAGYNVDGARIPVNSGDYEHPGGRAGGVEPGGAGHTMNRGRHDLRTQQPPHKEGRFPTNVILSHTPFCRQIGRKKVKATRKPGPKNAKARPWYGRYEAQDELVTYGDADGMEEVMVWDCPAMCPVRMLDEQSGTLKSGSGLKSHPDACRYGGVALRASSTKGDGKHWDGDVGGASRFFMCCEPEEQEEAIRFLYCAKASRSERDEGLDLFPVQHAPKGNHEGRDLSNEANHLGGMQGGEGRNTHPTVKPLALLEYLCTLTMPPNGGIVLDIFMGSGSGGVAAANTGRGFIGVEMEAEAFGIAQARIRYAWNKPRMGKLFE